MTGPVYRVSEKAELRSAPAGDAAGNLTQDASVSPPYTYKWDGEGRIASVTQGSTSTWSSFTYNALGQRGSSRACLADRQAAAVHGRLVRQSGRHGT
jgi:YD repeat-containing protein